ncbi:MAG TPA: hypothetical protein VF553_02950 [Pyrinomonadaceae bacterium]|jgi:hypothetical protein
MIKKLAYFVASMVMALTVTFALTSPNVGAKTDSCRTQCRVAYDKCVKQTNNPGGINQCGRAYQNCLSTCQ